jgi:hypothetical protein
VLYVSVSIAPKLVSTIHPRHNLVGHILSVGMILAKNNLSSVIDWVAYLTFNLGMPGIESVPVCTTSFLGIWVADA